MQVQLFGGVAATDDHGAPVDVGPAKCQALLAALALSAGSAVPVSRLVQMVWGEQPPRTAEKTLQSYVTRLRKGLGIDSIDRVGAAYRLALGSDAVDVLRFQSHLDAGDNEGALAEWTGSPLAGLEADGLSATIEGLIEGWLGATEAHLEHRVQEDPASAIGTLTELTAGYPFREGLWALLMTALYRAGRQADALAAYRRARERLVEHLGVEPGPRLRELEALILGQDEQLEVHRSPRGTALGIPTGTVTFGFSDVENSTLLWSTNRHEMAAAMARHDELVRQQVDTHGGYVFATGGDSFGVAFHRAGDAAAWARDLQAVADAEAWPGGAQIKLRTGLHTGETEERGKGYFGPDVIVAARLAAAGHGGQILVSHVTGALLGGNGLVELGTYRLDGVVGEQRILQMGSADYPPLRTDDSRRGNLPHRLGHLFGREDELDDIAQALTVAPVVTLVGPGGIGKTRLALASARRAEVDLACGAWLVELAGILSPDSVARAVAGALDIRERSGASMLDAVVAGLESRRLLLVLDNCEHVVDGAAELVEAVVARCPDVRILATSREGLGLRHEQLLAVSPLKPEGAGVELFNHRAISASQAFDPVTHRSEVAEICRRLDGVPLAIELAAARTRSLSPAEIIARLDDRLRLLTGGRRTSVERHRTLRATIQWSHDLLTAAEQDLFQRLSIFAGPFDLVAAETVAGSATGAADSVDVDQFLGSLVDRSMVLVESGQYGRRFRILETMRQFGAEHLSARGLTDGVAERHASWCLASVTTINTLLRGHDEIEAVARLDDLWPNLRAAFEFACATGDHQLAHDLLHPVATEVYMRSRSEIGEWAERLLAVAPDDDIETITFALTWAARRHMRTMDRAAFVHLVEPYPHIGDPMVSFARAFIDRNGPEMVQWARVAAHELRETGDQYLADCFASAGLGTTLLLAGLLEEHDALMNGLLERYRDTGPPTLVNWALTLLGLSAAAAGHRELSQRLLSESAEIEVPERTNSFRNPLEARGAFRRGNRVEAFRMLRRYVVDLLENDNLYMAATAQCEFVLLMAGVDELAPMARIVGHLEDSGFGERPEYGTAYSHAKDRLAGSSQVDAPAERALGAAMNRREALVYIRDELSLLAGDGPIQAR